MRGEENATETTESIPVTEQRRRQLRELKGENRSYDELLGLLVQEHKRRRLVASAREPADDHEPRIQVNE